MTKSNIAVVTGSSSGIGWAICEKLLAEQFQVYGISRSGIGPKSPKFIGIKYDLTDFTLYPSLVRQLPDKIDILVNDAGYGEEQFTKKISLAHINKTFFINFYAPALLTSNIINLFSSSAAIINISSVMSIISDPGYSIYCASKAALDRYTSTLAKEHPNFQVISVMPSGTKTPMYPQGTLLPSQIAQVVWDSIKGKYPSGSQVAVINHSSRNWWKEREKYDLTVDFG